VDERGQTSEVLLVSLTYEGNPDGAPRRLVAEVPSADQRTRTVQRALGSYALEVFFYRDFGDEAGVPTPRAFFADLTRMLAQRFAATVDRLG
jgi:hypothetical protein